MSYDIILTKWQFEVYEAFDTYRFVVVSAGRQSGKTFLGVFLLALRARQTKSINWWVSPTYQNSKIAFRRILELLQDMGAIFKTNRSELRIEFTNGSSIDFKSADREEGLRGETVDFMVIDEMGMIKRDAYQYALRGTITATRAPVLFIGTPKGKNLFYELYCKGQDSEEKDYVSFQFSSNESRYFSNEEWQEVQKLPQKIFEQEYKAKFIDDGGEVFRNVRECIKGDFDEKRLSKKTYFAGVDLAKSTDYTVICIVDQDGHVCAWDRFNDISWTIQKERIINLCTRFDAYILIDSTGLGDPILDDLSLHVRVEGYKFTNISKRQLIENLAIAVERQEVSFPEIPELLNELSVFTFDQTPGGLIRYSAPEGLHDDCVIALALAYYACHKNAGGSDIVGDIGERMEW